jgi:hypothetical protein
VGFDSLNDLLTQHVLFQQVPEGEDHGLIGDPIANQLDAGKAAHGGHLDQGFLHYRVAERIPLLLQMDSKHRGQRIRRSASFLALLGLMRLDQIDHGLQGHHRLHSREKLLGFGLLLARGQLVI